MRSWNWLRVGALGGGVALGALAAFVPVLAPYAAPAAAFLIGWGTTTPGQSRPPDPR
jgi:hypothetical protein